MSKEVGAGGRSDIFLDSGIYKLLNTVFSSYNCSKGSFVVENMRTTPSATLIFVCMTIMYSSNQCMLEY